MLHFFLLNDSYTELASIQFGSDEAAAGFGELQAQPNKVDYYSNDSVQILAKVGVGWGFPRLERRRHWN